jgi:hypothetical protein
MLILGDGEKSREEDTKRFKILRTMTNLVVISFEYLLTYTLSLCIKTSKESDNIF